MLPRVYARGAFVFLCVVALCGFALQWISASPTASITYDNKSLLRLHVIANSDSPADQNLKLAVRDAVMPILANLATTHDVEEAEQVVTSIADQLMSRARQVVHAAGRDYPVRVEVGDFLFPVKESPAITLPAGEYRAVRLVIGNGAGRNWWCVLFPPLCFAQETSVSPVVEAADVRSSGDARKSAQFGMRYLPQLSRKAIATKVTKVWQASIGLVTRWGAVEAHSR